MRTALAEHRLFLTLAMLGLLIVLIGGVLGLPTDTANADPTPPANDEFANATLVGEPLPFSDTVNTTAAGLELTFVPCFVSDLERTVWYSFTPSADVVVTADTFGSDFPAGVVVFVGNSLATLVPVACQGAISGEVVFPTNAGVTYSIQVGGHDFPPGGSLSFQMTVKPPPIKGNDDFADSVIIPEPLPFNNTQNVRGATFEAGEPQSCSSKRQTVWYSFTPTSDSVLTPTVSGSDFSADVAAYRGTILDTLTSVGCGSVGGSFTASAGVTYYFQVGTTSGNPGNLVFALSSAACPATGCVEVVMNITGGVCDDLFQPSTCDVPIGEEFGLSVEAVAVPPEGYTFMQTFVEFGDDLSYKPTDSALDEITWPDCSGLAARPQITDDTVGHGCATGILPPVPISHHVGTLVEFTLSCSQEVSSTNVRLLAYDSSFLSSVGGTSSTVFVLPSADFAIPKLRNLAINCVVPPPTPTPTPCPASGCPTAAATPMPTATPAATPCPPEGCPEPEMTLNVKSGATSCVPAKCDAPLNGKFTLAVEVVEMPAGGYTGAQTFIDYGPDLTYDSGVLSAADEIV